MQRSTTQRSTGWAARKEIVVECRVRLSAGALAMSAPRPATGPAQAFFQLLLGPADATLSSHVLLGILDPTDELVARQGRDVLPRSERLRVIDQLCPQICGHLVPHPTRHSLAHSGQVSR